jgi:uncharacterized membrane protein
VDDLLCYIQISDRDSLCRISTVECRASCEVEVPRAFAFQIFEMREPIPRFMDWIKEVKVPNSHVVVD